MADIKFSQFAPASSVQQGDQLVGLRGGVNTIFTQATSEILAVRLAATSNLNASYLNGAAGVGATLTNNGAQVALSIDGMAAILNDRILVENQSSALQNGVYIVTNIGSGSSNWVLTRASGFDQSSEILPGTQVAVYDGIANAGSIYVVIAPQPVTIGTDSILFSSMFQTIINNNYFLPLSGGTMTGFLILNADATNPLGAVTLEQLNAVAGGLVVQPLNQAATIANLNATYANGAAGVGATLTNAGTQAAIVVDGISLNLNDFVLVKNQTSTFQNGIYKVTTVGTGATNWVLTRATFYDQTTEIKPGTLVIISAGTVNINTSWIETATVSTIGTDPIVFNLFTANPSSFLKVSNNLSDVASVATSVSNLGLTIGTNTEAWSAQLDALAAIASNGIITRTGANTFAERTITGTAGTITITNGNGVSGNPTITIDATYVGQSSITTLGTITTGVWNGTIITGTYGGTGVNNGTNTITLGGNISTAGALTTVGAFGVTLTFTNTTSVTFPTSGTLATTANIPTLPLSLANGGTNANLTANNGGIFYSTSSAGAILAGTATAGQVLLSGATAAPTWSTPTYPSASGTAGKILRADGTNNLYSTSTFADTYSASNLLYSNGANTVTGLATGNNGVLITSGTGVPSISSTLPSAVQGNITSVGTITSGTWNGTIITGTYGGTGVNNGTSTITIGGNLAFSGAFATTITVTGTTTVTMPTSGTLATTSQIPSLPVSLANGGTGASLVANNGGIFYSTGSAGAILAGTATAGQILRSGSSAAPSWSTATFSSTYSASNLLYSNGANTVTGLATGNNGVLITDGSGVPSISSTLPSAVQLNITQVGTLTSGTWNATTIAANHGGTGVNNGASTITLGGSLTLSGAFTTTITVTGTTSVTMPTSGTLLTTTNAVGGVAIQRVTATGAFTYTPNANCIGSFFELWAGGGGGGGAAAGSVSSAALGSSGGGAGKLKIYATIAQINAAAVTGTVGAGGAGGAAGNNNGVDGTNSTILFNSSTWTAGGGKKGTGSAAIGTTQLLTGGAAGTNTTGSNATLVENFPGEPGGNGAISLSVSQYINFGGGAAAGGAGWGGAPYFLVNGTGQAGNAANGNGAGGSGASSVGSGAASAAGGNGSNGLLIVTELLHA